MGCAHCGEETPTTVLTQNLSVFIMFSKSKGRVGKSSKGEQTLETSRRRKPQLLVPVHTAHLILGPEKKGFASLETDLYGEGLCQVPVGLRLCP